MQRALKSMMLVVALTLLVAPARAFADGFVTPWAGGIFGSSAKNGRGAFGVAAGGMGAGIVGGEVDFGYSPSFFGTHNDFGHNTVIDLMGNVIIGIPVGGTHGASVRPYVTGGVGLIRTQIDGGTLFDVSTSDNQFGYDLGGGVMGFFGDHVGLRGDLRYFRDASGNVVNGVDLGTLHFWRASAGLVLR
jgi:opacity protein-like surface antigen